MTDHPPTLPLFRDDFYLSTAEAVVTSVHEDGAIELDQTCFYATSGGQPGDTGLLERADGSIIKLGETRHGADKSVILHRPLDGEALPEVGEKLVLHVDWPRRYKLMRMHTPAIFSRSSASFPSPALPWARMRAGWIST